MEGSKIILFGYEGGNLLGQLRTFGALGYRPTLVIVSKDKQPYFITKSRFVGDCHMVQSNEEGLQYILERFSNEIVKPIISTDSDAVISLLDQNYDRLKDKFIFFNAGTQGRLTPYMDKQTLCLAAEKYGLRSPKSERVKVGQMPKTLNYPIFTKAENSFAPGWKQNTFICHNEAELREAYRHISAESILLQEYVKKKNEYILQGLSFNNGNDVYIPIEGSYHRVNPKAYSQYLYFQPFMGGGKSCVTC